MNVYRPPQLNPDEAWEHYASLVRAANADATLFGDFKHCQAMALAYRRWQRLYLAMEAA